jgi:phosphopantetheine adenylyltransferase
MASREAVAVYPGTFDPLTRGHEDLDAAGGAAV